MGRLLRAAVAVAMGIMLSGCAGGPATFGSQTGTVTGHVLIRACGGAYRVDQDGCRISPASDATVTFSDGGAQRHTAQTDAAGSYRIDLAPGAYAVRVEGMGASAAYPSGTAPSMSGRFSGPTQITVTARKTVTADFTATIELL